MLLKISNKTRCRLTEMTDVFSHADSHHSYCHCLFPDKYNTNSIYVPM